MGRYVIRRVLDGLITIWLVTLFIFLLLRLTGNPIEILAPPETLFEDKERLKVIYGLDKPLWQQYLNFASGIVRGDFGVSLRWDDQKAFDVVLSRVPATLQLAGAALVFSIVVGVSLGVLSAAKPDTLLDRLGKVVAIAGQSMPVFWTALLLILVFSVFLGWLPSAGGISRGGVKALILPAVALGWFFMAAHMRMVRSAMLDVLSADYIKAVRARGMPRRIVLWKHALKNASIPIFTMFALNFAFLLTGTVITETIFTWPGIGSLVVDSVQARDYTVVQTLVFFASAVIVLTNILVDIVYAWLDPRIRFA
jgi:peptide/nickel transport system permease protein